MHDWFKSYGDLAELVDFAYWWSFSGEGSASAACAAGLLKYLSNYNLFIVVNGKKVFLVDSFFSMGTSVKIM